MFKKTILLISLLSLPAAGADLQGAAANGAAQVTAPMREADDIDIYLNMGGMKPLDQWSFALDAEDLKLAVPPGAFTAIRDTMDHLFLRVSVHLVKNGEGIKSAPVTPVARIPLESRLITGVNSECYLVNSTSVVVTFSGKQTYDAIKAMNLSYGEGVTTVLVPEVLRAEGATETGGRRSKQKDHLAIAYLPVTTDSNWATHISVISFNTNKLGKVSSAKTIEERELALFVKQEAAAAAMEALRKDLEGRLASETAARKAAEEKLASLVDQEVKEHQAALQKIEARLLALGSAFTNFAQVEFRKHAEELAGKLMQEVQVVSNVHTSVSSLATNLALTGRKVSAIGAAVDKLNGRSGWGNVFKSSETTTFGK